MVSKEVLTIPCPACGQPTGERCRVNGKIRRTPCLKRKVRYEDTVGWDQRRTLHPDVVELKRRESGRGRRSMK